MKLVLLNKSIAGNVLETPIYSASGMVVLNRGAVITEKAIEKLNEMGIKTAYVESEDGCINLQEAIDARLRIKWLKKLDAVFTEAKKKKTLDEVAIRDIVCELIDNINISENALTLFNNIGEFKQDMELAVHSLNVAVFSIILAHHRDYGKNKQIDIGIGAILHDIGKLFASGEDHCRAGFDFVRGNRNISALSNICVLSHHENVNGTGYPSKHSSDKIHEYAKIVSVANAYDNSLKICTLPHEAIELVQAGAGHKHDVSVFRDFLKGVYCYPNGLPVKLNNGQEGIVIMQNKNFPQRPVVKANNTTYDLTEQLTLFIEKIAI